MPCRLHCQLSSSRAKAHSTKLKLDKPMSFKRRVRRACLASVSSAPSKIPYGGFSPVRLQTGFFRRHLHQLRRLIDDQLHQCLPDSFPRSVSGRGAGLPIHSGPEALGFSAGYIVPPVFAYYGLIRASVSLRTAYKCLRCPVAALGPHERLWAEIRGSLI